MEKFPFRAPQALPTIAVLLLGLMATPVVVSAQALEFASVSAGYHHSCGLTTAGAAYCWGWNSHGQLGDGTNTDRNVPVAVSGGHTFASVSAGSLRSCGLTTAGAAFCWGWNGSGGLGDGTNTNRNVPVAVSGGHTFAVSAGGSLSCGVTTAGAAYCWGANDDGELGDGTNTDRSVPVAVSGGHTFASVSAGGSLSCGVTTAGAAYCWGGNIYGQLGDGTKTASSVPVAVSGGHTFASVSAGSNSCGVTTAGAAYCWGWNSHGQLGDGTNTDRNVPAAVSGGHTFASVSAGGWHSCGVTTAGAAYCWGTNALGRLGNGTNTDAGSNVPVAVSGGHPFTSVSTGEWHGCGVTTAGAAYCWGSNRDGELGDGTNTDSDVGVEVKAAVNPPAAAAQPVGGEGQAGFEQVLGDLLPATPNGQATRFTLTPGFTHFHWVSSPGETRTAVIDPDDFDAVVTVWQKEGRFDASSNRPEEVAVGPGDWMVVVESFDQGAGSYEFSIPEEFWSSTETLVSGPWKRTTHQISNVPSGETRHVVVSSSDFDVVLEVFQRMRRVDEHPAGTAEEVVLNGNWELVVKSRDGRSGAYALTLR